MNFAAPDNILIRGVNWVGDAVMTMPAVRALRKAYPGAGISLLARPSILPLFERDPNLDSLISYGEKFRGILGRLRLAFSVRRMGFSKAVLFQNAFDAALIAFLAGIPERIGYNRDGRGKLLTRPVPFNGDDRKLHHIRYYLDLLRAAGIPAEYSRPFIYLELEERLSARKVLSVLRRPVLGINPGAAYGSAKRWFPERYVEVADRFISDTSGSVVLFGGNNEKEIATEIEKLMGRGTPEALNLAGRTTLRELAALISECDVMVANDSGPMHIGYAVGTPLVGIFGSTDPGLTGPPEKGGVVLKSDVSCSPCFERTCGKNDMRCMDAITSGEVYQALKEIMPRRRAVFFDRDGTLCRDAHYLNNWNDFELLPEIGSLSSLKEQGFALIGVTNQSGIYRGIVDEAFVNDVNRLFIDKYGFDDFFYCPHGPDEHCPCRKPEPGMALDARARHGIDMKRSYVVGDKDADLLLARAVGAKGILVRGGKQHESEYADFTANNLKEVVNYILADG